MSNSSNSFVFGKFTLDTRQQVLLFEGKHIPLTPKAFEILVTLIENRDRIVTKEELMDRVWPDTVVEEINIAKNISLLRKILANGNVEGEIDIDESQQNHNLYIRTIPKRGYQFVYEIQEREMATAQQPSPKTISDQTPNLVAETHQPKTIPESFAEKGEVTSYRWLYVTILAAIVVTFPILLSSHSKETESVDVSKLAQSRLDSWKGGFIAEPLSIRMSPDGNMIAFSKGNTGQTDIYVQQLAGGKTLAVTTEEWPDYSPIWSSDGQRIAYISKRQKGNELWIIPSLGGKGEMICPLGDAYLQLLRWSKDGTRIFYVSALNLFVLDLKSGLTTQLTNFSTSNPLKSKITLSYDEKKIAYMQSVAGSARIFVASLDGSSPIQITSEGDRNNSPVWFADGSRILYASTNGDIHQICIAYLDGRKPVQLWSSHYEVIPSQVSTDGRRIFYFVTTEEADIFRYDLAAKTEIPITSDSMLKVWPDVSPDGKAIALQKVSTGVQVLRSLLQKMSLGDAGATDELATDGFDVRWSPPGDRLAFLRSANGEYHLWTVRSDGAEQKQISNMSVLPNGFGVAPYNWIQPNNYSWSPDGKTLAFCAVQPSAVNVWQVSADGGAETRLTNNDDPAVKFASPMWSPDGKRLAYLAQTKRSDRSPKSIIVYEGGQTRTIFQTDLRLRLVGWSAQGTHFLAGLVAPEETVARSSLKLVRISLAGKSVETLGEFPAVNFNSLRLSPDGNLLGFVSQQNQFDNVWIATVTGGHSRMLTSNTDARLQISGPAWLPNNKGICFTKQYVSTTLWSMENVK